MPIKLATKSDNGVNIEHHKIAKFELDFRSNRVLLIVSSWPVEQDALDKKPQAWTWDIFLASADAMLSGTANIVDKLEAYLITDTKSPFYGGTVVTDKTLDLATLKSHKNDEINRARLAANRTSFIFQGKDVACDELSRSDIDGTNGDITLTRAMPVDWVGGWKAKDNSTIPIPDVATWTLFYQAMTAQGNANFRKAQTLKTQLSAATDATQVAEIVW
jgi:hypothetical protein